MKTQTLCAGSPDGTPLASPRVLETHPVHEAQEAAEYENMIDRHAWLLNRPMVELLTRTRLTRGRVLDIGTGPGWIPIELALRHPRWEIWAVDPSGDMLARSAAAARRRGVADRIHFIKGNAGELDFKPGMFDLVYSHLCFTTCRGLKSCSMKQPVSCAAAGES